MKIENKDGGLAVTPNKHLKFVGPFDRKVVAKFRTNNMDKNRYGFKIKSNAAHNRLFVKPNIGVIEPGQEIVHSVTLMPEVPFRNSTPLEYTMLIQSVPIGPTVLDVKEIWDNEDVENLRLQCVYETEGHRLVRQVDRRQTMPLLRRVNTELNRGFVETPAKQSNDYNIKPVIEQVRLITTTKMKKSDICQKQLIFMVLY